MTRFAKVADISAIRAVAKAPWDVTYASIISREQIDYMFKRMYDENLLTGYIEGGEQVFLLEEIEGVVVGFAAFSLRYPSEEVCRVHKLYLRPDMKGKGVGKRLLEEVKQKARSAGLNVIQLNVNKQNPAFQFYLALGFQVLREEVLAIGEGYVMDDYVMVCTL